MSPACGSSRVYFSVAHIQQKVTLKNRLYKYRNPDTTPRGGSNALDRRLPAAKKKQRRRNRKDTEDRRARVQGTGGELTHIYPSILYRFYPHSESTNIKIYSIHLLTGRQLFVESDLVYVRFLILDTDESAYATEIMPHLSAIIPLYFTL